MQIDNHAIGPNHSPYIIAELGINHGGDAETAHQLLEAAARSGADAAKLQTFGTERLVSRSSDFFDLLKDTELTAEEIASLVSRAKKLDITLFAAVFDEESADLWERLEAPVYKIASGDLTHLPLIRHVATKGKPMILSSGGCTLEEIDCAVDTINNTSSEIPYAILHCVSNYPTVAGDTNLACLAGMRSRYNAPVGFSDHTTGIAVSIAAAALGAEMIEKHFTLDREMPGPDHMLSTNPQEFKAMSDGIREAHDSIGSTNKRPVEPADFIPQIRRSVTAMQEIPVGTVITRDMLAVKRPGTGIAPDDIGKIIGNKSATNIGSDVTMSWDMVDGIDG